MAQNDYMAVRFLKIHQLLIIQFLVMVLVLSAHMMMLLSEKGNNVLEANLKRRMVMTVSPLSCSAILAFRTSFPYSIRS